MSDHTSVPQWKPHQNIEANKSRRKTTTGDGEVRQVLVRTTNVLQAPTRFQVYLNRLTSSSLALTRGASSNTSVSVRQLGVATRHRRQLRRVYTRWLASRHCECMQGVTLEPVSVSPGASMTWPQQCVCPRYMSVDVIEPE